MEFFNKVKEFFYSAEFYRVFAILSLIWVACDLLDHNWNMAAANFTIAISTFYIYLLRVELEDKVKD